jgi:hypothetical protein
MTLEEKGFVTKAIFAAGIGAGILGAAIVALQTMRGASGTGDTPVVLIGGSLTFKAGDANYAWQNDSATEYHISPTYPIASIAVKAKAIADSTDTPVGSDGDPASDVLRLDVNGASWQIDEYASNPAINNNIPYLAASITSQGNAIYVNLKDQGGFLCDANKNHKRILYGHAQDCSDADKFTFTQAGLTVTSNGQSQATGFLNCIDQNTSKGTCRIVFRGAPK